MNLIDQLSVRLKLASSYIDLNETKLDAKLQIYQSIRESCEKLTDILENYQSCLYVYSNELNCLGILLKEFSKHDKTKAGKMMLMSSKSLNYSSHHMIKLYMPLLRLFQEMETFHSRAVEDTSQTTGKLEERRLAYKGALLSMKEMGDNLDPEIYREFNRYRRVQNKVRNEKRVFDAIKMDVVQKIDLLMASRCNLMNQILGIYQPVLLDIFEKSEKHLKATIEMMNQEDIYEYEFKTLKQLNPLVISDSVEEAEEAGEAKSGEEKIPSGAGTTPENEANLLGDFEEETQKTSLQPEKAIEQVQESKDTARESELINLNDLEDIDSSSYFKSLQRLQI